MLAHGADRQIRRQPACPRTPAAARPGGNREVSKRNCGVVCRLSGRDEAALRGRSGQSALAGLGAEEPGQGRSRGVELVSAGSQKSTAASRPGPARQPEPCLPANLHPEGPARDPL